MKLVILGSGTSVPHATRASAANWLETESGSLLLDISADSAHRMAEEGLDWPNLDVIWVSHFHLDHLGGLGPFLFGTKWSPQTQKRTKPLRIYGPAGLLKILKAVNDSNNYGLLEQSFAIELKEVEAEDEFEILPNLKASTFSTPHTNESLAIRLTEKTGTSFVYTSDTGYAESLAAFAKRANLFLMECSFRQNKPVAIHLDLSDAMQLARAAEPEMVVLTHLYPEWDGIDISQEARALWQGEVIAATDGLRLEF
jgi:ribonuclease BN (tRNA processing enzyme)